MLSIETTGRGPNSITFQHSLTADVVRFQCNHSLESVGDSTESTDFTGSVDSLEPESVAASPSAIRSVDEVPYSNTIEPCPICLETFQNDHSISRMPCGHHYHKTCLTNWLHKHNSCPVCRHPLPEVSETPRDITIEIHFPNQQIVTHVFSSTIIVGDLIQFIRAKANEMGFSIRHIRFQSISDSLNHTLAESGLGEKTILDLRESIST